MKIGIDLDNTIINYEKVFLYLAIKKNIIPKNTKILTKKKLKKYILEKNNNGNKIWMSLQGKVYGEYINKAQLMDGFKTFLNFCKIKNYQVSIISHKTIFGHYDKKKINLRLAATNFLSNNNLFDKDIFNLKKKNIYFLSSLDRKIKKINALDLDYFIDDLEKVLNHSNINKNLKNKILFQESNIASDNKLIKVNNWNDINNDIFFKKLKNKDIIEISKYLGLKNITKVQKINEGINSKVFKVRNKENLYAYKFYPFHNFDDRPRQDNEYKAIKYLIENNYNFVAKPIYKNNLIKLTIFKWIIGKKKIKLTTHNFNNFFNFIIFLKKLSLKTNFIKFNTASEGTDNLKNIYKYNELRILNLKKNKNIFTLSELLNDIEKLNKINKNKLDISIRNKKLSPLKKNQLILSPSDISLNNILSLEKNDYFIDLEYFGWDDPVKLISDYIIHPKNKFTKQQMKKILIYFFKIFENDYQIKKRLLTTFNLYLIRWSLILLNDYRNHNKTTIANKLIHKNQDKIKLSKKIINDIKKNSYIKFIKNAIR